MTDANNGALMYAPEIEAMPREQLAALQLEKLQKIVRHAYENVAHYQKTFSAAGVTPDDLRSLDDFAKFPFTMKTDLRDNYPFGMFAVPREEVIRVHASSGTTGKPTVVGYTKEDLDVWSHVMARSLVCMGVRPGDMAHNAYGYGLFTGGLGLHYGAETLGCTVTPASGGFTERQIVLMQDFGARVLFATPSYALNIAEVAEKEGVDLKGGPLEIAVCGAEPWTDSMRKELDRRLGVKAVDTYGLSEIIGPGVAAECIEQRNGLHAWEDNFLLETIDPETGERTAPGEPGELVITTLAKWAQPMIRYRTRDITRLDTTPCACGRTHVRIMRVTGRDDDMLIIRGVNLYPSQVEDVLVGRPSIEPHYQLVVQREGSMDTLTVEVEASPGVVTEDYDGIAKDVQHHIKSRIGVTCRIVVLSPGEVPRSEGKAVRVRDMRPKD
ncbi:MAG: phenylacetate--CoA ligase [Rhodospirillaceae bacterium]|nr:phenylacetate--CoA ligase [Rhodospirillaceae bacterium]